MAVENIEGKYGMEGIQMDGDVFLWPLGVAVFLVPPPAPFQGRRVGIIFWFSITSPLDVT